MSTVVNRHTRRPTARSVDFGGDGRTAAHRRDASPGKTPDGRGGTGHDLATH